MFAAALDTLSFDGIVFDTGGKYFKVGKPPFYVQIKTRGSSGDHYHPQGHSITTFEKIQSAASQLGIPEDSLYLVVGFFMRGDLRQIRFFGIPFNSLSSFRSDSQYRFSVEKCEEAMKIDAGIFSL